MPFVYQYFGTAQRYNPDATVNPTVNDDNTGGYAIGSHWINTTTDEDFICLDATTGAAVWKSTTAGGVGAVMQTDYNAQTILAATTDNNPAPLTVGEATFVGRATGGNIAALSATQSRTILNVADGAQVNPANMLDADVTTGTDTTPKTSNAAQLKLAAQTWGGSALSLAASTLAGRGSAAGTGAPVQITIGTNLSMSGTTLNAAGGSSSGLTAVTTLAALKALAKAGLTTGDVRLIRGYAADNDGGQGKWLYNSASTATANEGTVVATNEGGSGRWFRIDTGPISARWFGATGDGTTNDTTALQSWLNMAGTLYLPPGTYRVNTSLTMSSNTYLYGNGGSIFSIGANSVWVLRATTKSNIHICGITFDGNGSTTTSGYQQGRGIVFDNVNDFSITDCTIFDMGCMNAVVQTDTATGGYGISIGNSAGSTRNGVIERCKIYNIAGGGMNSGDGICFGSTNAGAVTQDMTVSDCWVSTCGRHCYTIANGGGPAPTQIYMRNCYAEKASLDGLDFEEGSNCVISGCHFVNCGNDQTFYNPVTEYGATYRLLAAVAHGGASHNITVKDCYFSGSYYGITHGAGTDLRVENCYFTGSTVSDFDQGLSNAGVGLKIRNTFFGSSGDLFSFYNAAPARCNFLAEGCTFTGIVKATGLRDATFRNCVFLQGTTPSGFEISDILWDSCEFRNFAGIGIDCNNSGQNATDCTVQNCRFVGTGTMTHGIRHGYNCVSRWKISGNQFIGMTTAGISHSNGNAVIAYTGITDNTFRSCAAGIDINQAVNNSVISGNSFASITGWALGITAITSGAALSGTVITNNAVAPSCANGIRITLSGGSWNHCVVSNNNVGQGLSGTRWSLASGNAGGVTESF